MCKNDMIECLSSLSKEMYDLNECVIECVNCLKETIDEDEIRDNIGYLEDAESQVKKWMEFNTKYLSNEGYGPRYLLELDKKALEIMLSNIKERKTESVLEVLYKKHVPVVKCLPSYGKLTFYCPFCETWHKHSEVGYKESTCVDTLYKGGEYMPRDNPLKNGYYVEMMSEEELRQIRKSINMYLGE